MSGPPISGTAATHLTCINTGRVHVGQHEIPQLGVGNATGAVLHVEVKGTRTLGEKVVLTANEVEHTRLAARCGAEHVLYVLSQIEDHR